MAFSKYGPLTATVETVNTFYDSDGKILRQERTSSSRSDVTVPVSVTHNVRLNRNLLHTQWIKDWTDIAVAGGHVLNAIMDDAEASEKGDVDIFFVGSDVTKERMRTKISTIFDWLKEYYRTEPVVEARGSSIRFFVPSARARTTSGKDDRIGLKVQVIFLTSFPSVEALLASFDLNNCQFAMQDQQLYATAGSIRYLTTREIAYFNPKNDSRRKIRMLKYKTRPYNRVVDVDKCPEGCSDTDLIDYYKETKSIIARPLYGKPLTLEEALALVE